MEENPIVKKIRTTKSFIWLYHGTPFKNINNIKKNGIDPKYSGTTMGAPKEHPSGKNAISYTTCKMYALSYTGIIKPGAVLLVKVPTKTLFFGIRKKWMRKLYLDEYQSIDKIKPWDVLFPGTLEYKKIEKESQYLQYVS